MKRIFISLIAICLYTIFCNAQTITNPPVGIGIDSYYTKYINCNGIHIVASANAPDSCILRAYNQIYAITNMISKEVLKAMTNKNARVVIMGRYEGITQLPEYVHRKGIEPSWDIHYRSMGATEDCPITLGAEENILAYQIDPNYAEDIMINALSQSIFTLGISQVTPNSKIQLSDLYKKAIADGKWKNTISANSMIDYWAEGVQDWFDVNAESPMPNGEHNWVNTRDDLKKYDIGLYNFIATYFQKTNKHISKHPKVNIYLKDDKKAYAELHAEKKLNIEIPKCKIETVSAELAKRLKLDTLFYKKYVNCNGIHILSSKNVPDSCLVQAHKTIYCMTNMLPKEVHDAMTKVDTRVVVMGRNEVTVQVPEHSGMVNDKSLNWNLRARGLGGSINEPITSCAEENIMAYPWDKYHAEDILIHEFSHSIHLIGIIQVDPTINDKLQDLLDKAKAAGKWKDTYAGTVYEEYWAEGVQDWFNVNAEVPKADTKHNPVNTREELKAYDPGLYALIAKYFPETNAQISKHKKENRYTFTTKLPMKQ